MVEAEVLECIALALGYTPDQYYTASEKLQQENLKSDATAFFG